MVWTNIIDPILNFFVYSSESEERIPSNNAAAYQVIFYVQRFIFTRKLKYYMHNLRKY